MKNEQGMMKDKRDSDILYSKTVKAGKRVYYIDVKRDRKGDFYVSLTESKRVKDGDVMQKPAFEKHKIFLYQEDLEKFRQAFEDVVDYTNQQVAVDDAAAEEAFDSEVMLGEELKLAEMEWEE